MQNMKLKRTCTRSFSFHENNFYPGGLVFTFLQSAADGGSRGGSAVLQLHERDKKRWRRDNSTAAVCSLLQGRGRGERGEETGGRGGAQM